MPHAVVGMVAAPLVGMLGEGAAIAVASFVLKAAGTVAVSTVANKLGRQKSSVGERQAQAVTLSIGEVPREVIFGTTRVGGSLVDIFNFGGKYGTDTVTYCVALADHAIDGIEGFYVDDVYYDWVGEGLQAAFNGKLSFHFRNAAADGYDPPAHVKANSDWTNADRLCGVTHMWIDVHYDDKVWTQGLPKISFVLNGLKAYDPRHDPANGYVGDQPMTWGNPATHRFTRNPIIQRYAFTRGIYVEGRHGQAEHLLFGRGLTNDVVPSARQIGHANVCDEFPDGDSPTGRRRYVSAGAIQANLDFVQVEQMFAAAMAGVIVQRDGSIEIEPGQAKPALITITDDDLVVGEPISWSAFLPDKDGGRINSVIPRYVEPAQGFKDHAGVIRRDTADIAMDGGPRELTLSLPLVTVAAQADDLAEINRRMARLEGRGGVTLPSRFSGVEEGDWIAWTSKLMFGGATIILRVEAFALSEAWRNRLTLRQMTASVFGGVDVILSPVPAPPVVAAPDPIELDNVEVEPITLPPDAADGEEPGPGLPALRFTWDPPGPEVVAVEVQVQTVGGGLAVSRSDGPLRGELTVTNGVAAGAELQVRVLPIGDASREIADAPWLTVTTEPLAIGVNPEQLETAVNTAVATATAALEAADASLQAAMIVVQNAQAALSAALGAAETSLQAAIDAVDTKADGIQTIVTSQGLVLAGKASQTALDAQIARIDTSLASIGTINATLADLPNHYASASQFLSIKSEVEAARGGSVNLSGRFSTLVTAITDGLALKVDVSTFNLLVARVTAAEGDVSALEGAVSSAQSAIADLQAGKVNLSDFTSLSGTVSAQGTTLSGHGSRLTTVELALPGKVNLTDFTTLQGTVTSQGATLSGHATRLAAVEIEAAGKVGVSVTNAISARLNSGGDVYASILSAASVAASADGKASAVVGFNLDVNGRAIGVKFANDGTTGALDVLTDYVTFRSLDAGAGYIRMAGGNLKVFSGGGVDVVTIGIV